MTRLRAKLRVHKCELIDAILTEPLISMNWIEDDGEETLGEANRCNSNVCAVGAFLRDRVDQSMDVGCFGDICASAGAYGVKDRLREVELFQHLVPFFDQNVGGMGYNVPVETRFTVAEYINDNFPAEVVIESRNTWNLSPSFCNRVEIKRRKKR